MRYQYYTADVFTRRIFGGNQLAVFPHASGLNDTLMQQITREFNLSETVFVFPPDDMSHTYRLRIFTPAMELPFAGHPTIGAAYVLAHIGMIPLQGERTQIIFAEGVGPVHVSVIRQNDGLVFAQLTAALPPTAGPPAPDVSALAAMLSLNVSDFHAEPYRPQAMSCGVPFLIVPLQTRAALAKAHVQHDQWERLLANFWAPQLYLIAFDEAQPDEHLFVRMFAPAMGITEDPATGAAAAALAGYLGSRSQRTATTLHWRIDQGIEMGRPSQIEVEADMSNQTVQAIRVGGASVLVSEGVMTL